MYICLLIMLIDLKIVNIQLVVFEDIKAAEIIL